MMRFISLVISVFWIGLWCPSVLAEQADGVEPQEESIPQDGDGALVEARLHFDQGLRLVRRENWAAALAEFDESIRLYPTAVALFNRGLCLRYLNRYPESIEAFAIYLERHPDEIDDERRANVEHMVQEMRSLLNEVTVNVNLEGATISIDSREIGRSPLGGPISLTSGQHEIEVRLQGYRTVHRTVSIVAGRTAALDIELIAPPRQGRLRVEANLSGATVLVDGVEVGETPYVGTFDEGEHEIVVSADDYRQSTQNVAISADDDRIVTVILSSSRVHRAWFWSMIGLTALGTLTTAGLGIAVTTLDDRYDPWGVDANDQYDHGLSLVTGADVTFSLTCVVAAAALILAFFTDWRGESTTNAVVLSGDAFPEVGE
jgi:predicted RNA-binding protein with TRAM domain